MDAPTVEDSAGPMRRTARPTGALWLRACLVVVMLAAACSSSVVEDRTSESSGPSATATAASASSVSPVSDGSASPTPAVEIAPVDAPWTRAVDAAIGGREVSVAVGVGDRIVYAHAGTRPRIPASNQKLLTSMVALDTFGADHRFPTIAGTGRPVHGGVVRGDLWLVGSGDPELDDASIARLAAAVSDAGVTAIHGRVMGDTSAFTREWWAPGWVPGLSRSYVNRTTALAFEGNAGGGLPEEAASASLTDALRADGVDVRGSAAVGEAPDGLRSVARISSRPLHTLLAVQNQGSVNFYAETLLKAIGARTGVGSTEAGADAVARWAAAHGVEAQVRDGSGLSHQDLISAQGLASLLLLAQDEPWGAVLDASLAPAGEGTLAGRLVGVPVRAKTGTLFETPVSSLSGYVTDAGGARIAFVVLSRGLDKGTAIGIEDTIVRTLAAARIA